jgi:hypothetical protein
VGDAQHLAVLEGGVAAFRPGGHVVSVHLVQLVNARLVGGLADRAQRTVGDAPVLGLLRLLLSTMATRKTSKTPARKATTAKAKPKTATAAKAKPAAFEKKVGDEKLLAAAVESATASRQAKTKRDEAIRAAVKSGTSARQVAIAVGLTHPAVLKIVKR